MRLFLIEARKSKGLKQKEVSEAVGISQTGYCNIEKGKRNPSVNVAKKLGKLLDIDWTMFFSEKN